MFERGYEYRHASTNAVNGIRKRIYTFTADNHLQYIVEVEEHPNNVFVIKFYLHNHRLSDQKYSLTVDGSRGATTAQRVFRTCGEICMDIFNENGLASFALIASPSKEEERYFNVRYRIYRQIIADWFSDEDFLHINTEAKSAYLILNRKNNNPRQLARKIIQEFALSYPDLMGEESYFVDEEE